MRGPTHYCLYTTLGLWSLFSPSPLWASCKSGERVRSACQIWIVVTGIYFYTCKFSHGYIQHRSFLVLLFLLRFLTCWIDFLRYNNRLWKMWHQSCIQVLNQRLGFKKRQKMVSNRNFSLQNTDTSQSKNFTCDVIILATSDAIKLEWTYTPDRKEQEMLQCRFIFSWSFLV